MRTIVILGAGFTGLPLAHKLLKYTASKKELSLKVILVSPSSHFYWNLAATRGAIPGAIADEALFLPIESVLKQYPKDHWEFVLGRATALDAESNRVEVAVNGSIQDNVRQITYDYLVIATGSHIPNDVESSAISKLPYKLIGTYEETLEAWHALQDKIGRAKHIVIAGAGPTGVEVAGELAAHYGGKKEIHLINANEKVLSGSNVLPSLANLVEQDLRKLGVQIRHKTKVSSAETHNERTTIQLSDGETISTDVYLPMFGVRVNSDFIPSAFLDKHGNLQLDSKTLRVRGATNIWGIGDVGNHEAKQVTNTDSQIIYLADVLDRVLTGQDGAHGKAKEYKPLDKTLIFLSLGPKHGTGQIMGWRLFSWMVNREKGRKIFVDTAPDYVGGKKLRHASM